MRKKEEAGEKKEEGSEKEDGVMKTQERTLPDSLKKDEMKKEDVWITGRGKKTAVRRPQSLRTSNRFSPLSLPQGRRKQEDRVQGKKAEVAP